MLHLFATLLSLLLIGHGFFCVEEDNLRNALNSIANRQRQLATANNYYVVPNKEADKEVPFEDELMYLDSPPREYDFSNREPIGYPYSSRPPSKPHRYYEEDRTPELDTEEYQKELKERLIERLMLDILDTDEDGQPASPPTRSRPQKKSFFREREISEIPENLQNLYGNGDQEESPFLPPSPFRERAKTTPRSHRHLVKSYEADEPEDEADDYLQAFNTLLEKYRDITGQDFDAGSITNEDVKGFLKFLNDKEPGVYYEYVIPDQEQYSINSVSRDESKRSPRGKRYWLGSHIQDRNNDRFLIQKRSAVQDKSSSTTDKINVTAQPEVTKSPLNKTKAFPKKADSGKPDKYRNVKSLQKGQKEMPVDLKSERPLNIKKKSVDWSTYFGVDKRQKKSDSKDQRKNDVLLDQYIQNYILQSVRNSAFANRGSEYRYFPKRNVKYAPSAAVPYPSQDQLETEEDLRTAEDLIIDNVLKYTGAHEGIEDQREIQRLRENVINQLAAAYNLEKLRKELFDDTRRKKYSVADDMAQHHHSNDKRVATKKDSANSSSSGLDDLRIKRNTTFFNHEHVSKPSTHDYSKRRYEVESFPGTRCPAINRLVESCQQISRIVKDTDGTFIPLCALHQICTVCGSKEESQYCDIEYTNNVNSICGDEPSCGYQARRVLIALQDVKNIVDVCHPCIANVLQYISE